jgi:ketosteroid isomerase-like protein
VCDALGHGGVTRRKRVREEWVQKTEFRENEMDDLSRLLAYEQIRQLVAGYALAMDSRDIDALVGLYVDDVRVGRRGEGREALRADFVKHLRGVGITILFVGNHVIDIVDRDHATGVVYCKGEIQDKERWISQAIQYRDTYERRDARWYFVRRRHLLWYGTERGENPLELDPANWPQSHTGKGTLPESWETWQRFWAEVGD